MFGRAVLACPDGMHHDQTYQRLMQLLERDIKNMLERQNARIRGHDEINLDLGRGEVVYARGNKPLWTARAELIGSFLRDVSIWRWWWYGSDRPVTRSPMNTAYAAGQSHGVKMLTSAQPIVRDDREAVLLANVCAALAKAQGVHLAQSGERMTFYALFGARDAFDSTTTEAPSSPGRRSRPGDDGATEHLHGTLLPVEDPMPPVGEARPPIMSIAPGAFGPLPPVSPPPMPTVPAGTAEVAPVAPTAPATAITEPPRPLVMPLAKLALASVVTHLPGFQQALVTLDLQVQDNGRARFFVVVSATDMEGNLVAVPTPQGLMEAARDLIAEDARRGNGRWHRLTARLKNKPTGISVRVKVFA